jgi:large subunit ribosomal protein L3
MPKPKSPRRGSMAVWPRVRAARQTPKVRTWVESKNIKLLGFAGYKAGMTHVMVTDGRKNSATKGEDIFYPVTIIECPPLKIASIRFYKNTYNGLQISGEIFSKVDKELDRKISIPKKHDEKRLDTMKHEEYADIRVLVYTQPKLTGIGKKKPELFEVALGGSIADKFKYAKENLGKEISIKDIFAEGQQIDMHAVTKGKGYQGPVKRFGVKIRQHKSEKTKRGPGAIGGWWSQGHVMYRVAHAGQMGYHQRVDYNKQILKISDKPVEVNPAGGFKHYGLVKTAYIMVKGSVPGPAKRLIRFTSPARPNKKFDTGTFNIQYISVESKQGN